MFHRFQTSFSAQRNLKAGVNNELWSFFRCAMIQPIIFSYLGKRTQKVRREFVQGCTSINVFTARKLKGSTSAMHLFDLTCTLADITRGFLLGDLGLWISFSLLIDDRFIGAELGRLDRFFLKERATKNRKIFKFDSDLS